MTARVLFLALVLTGCSGISSMIEEANYITFEHDFTDAAALNARSTAEKLCAQRKQAAIKTQSTCSLSKCFTNYQCVPASGAASVPAR